MNAARQGHREVAQLLLDEQADVNAENTHGLSALAYAAKFGFANVGELLLEAKAVVDAPNHYGITPLMHSANWGRRGMVQLLLDRSANVAACAGKQGRTVLHRAADRGHFEVCRMLLQAKAVPDELCGGDECPLEFQFTALGSAAADGHAEVVQVLLAAGANPSGAPWSKE